MHGCAGVQNLRLPLTTMHHGTSTLSFLFVAPVEMSHQTIVNRNEEQSVRFFRGRAGVQNLRLP